jgi:ATP-binding cassette subfamily B protein
MLKFIFKYALKFWWQILIMLALSILSSQINLELPKYTSKIINEGVAHRDLAHVYALGWQMIGFSILSGTVMILSMFFSTRIAAGIARNLREATFAKIESFSLKEFGKFSVASLITRITNDASQFQQTFSMTLRMGTYAIFSAWVRL